MRSFTPLLVFILSFVSLAVSSPLHSNTHSSRLTSRQFHYPRALVDVCAHVDLSLAPIDVLGLNLGNLADICLCLSAFPLRLDMGADLVDHTKLETHLKSLVEEHGTHCTYPDYASPRCTSGDVCGFTCTDGFVKNGGTCLCPRPNSVCNGKCGSYPNGCSSALPRAPKMARRSIAPSHSGGPPRDGGSRSPTPSAVDLVTNVNLNLDGSLDGLLSGSELDLDVLVNQLLQSLGISVPNSGGNQSGDLEAELRICTGASISGTQSLLDTITGVVNSLLSSLLGTTVQCKVKSSCSPSVDPHTMSIDLQVCGLSGLSLESTLDKALKAVANLLNGLLDDVNVVTTCSVGGSGCPATPTLSSPSYPLPSSSSLTSVDVPHPNVSPSPPAGIDSSGLLNGLLAQVNGVLVDLGLSLGNYTLDTGAGLVAGVSVVLSDTLGSIDGSVPTVIALVDETLDLLLACDITVQTDPDQSSSSAPSHPSQGGGMVVNIDLGAVLDATLSNTAELVDEVLSAVSGVLAALLNADVVVNVDGGHGCGCGGSKKASAKQRVEASSHL